MRISDWSSDVCSSDLPQYSLGDLKRMPAHKLLDIAEQLGISDAVARARKQDVIFALLKVLTRTSEGVQADGVQIGRASCRASVGQYVSISVVALPLTKTNR